MKNILILMMVINFVLITTPVLGGEVSLNEREVQTIQIDIKNLTEEVEKTKKDYEKIRNDQINYKLEKDMLKEVYTVSLSTINYVMTFLLGFFTVASYFGFRNIKEVQKEYKEELDSLKNLKSLYDDEFKSLKTKLKEFDKEIKEIFGLNQEQDKRLKVLELTEKISALFESKNYVWALNHIDIGLKLDPDNLNLRHFKANCHGRLGEHTLQIKTYKDILVLEKDDREQSALLVSLLEAYIATNQYDEFDKLLSENIEKIKLFEYWEYIEIYFRILKHIQSENLQEAKRELLEVAIKFNGKPAAAITGNWVFEEMQHSIQKLKNANSKKLFAEMARFFSGLSSSEHLINQISGL